MALTRMHHAGRRRYSIGALKRLEQSGDWTRLLEKTIQLSVEHGDHEEAERLRQQLNPQPITQEITQPAYQAPHPLHAQPSSGK